MAFRIVVTEIFEGTNVKPEEVERYRQTVDVVDLVGLIAAINRKPRKPRERKAKVTA